MTRLLHGRWVLAGRVVVEGWLGDVLSLRRLGVYSTASVIFICH